MTDALAEVTSWVFCDMADPREFVSKMNPTGSDMHVPGTDKSRAHERHLAATGLAATGVATLGGGHAISATLKENKGRVAAAKKTETAGKLARATRVTPVRAAELTGSAWLALHGVELTGDALAMRAQARSYKRNKPTKPDKRTAIAARAPGQLVPLSKASPLSGLHRVGQFAQHQGLQAHMAAQAADIAKPLAPSPTATRAVREKQIAREGNAANRKANRAETTDKLKASAQGAFHSLKANPHVQDALHTVVEGVRQAATKPAVAAPKPLTQRPAVLAGAGAVAGGGAVAYSQRRRRGPISARAPQDVVDLEFAGQISKVDTDKRLVFGWASISKVNGEPYVDRQGDWIPTDEAETAAYAYVKDSRVGGDMHRRAGITKEFGPHKVADLVESFFVTPEKLSKMGLPEDALPEGWWVGMKVHDDETWGQIKDGKRTGFSVHGSGVRKDVTL